MAKTLLTLMAGATLLCAGQNRPVTQGELIRVDPYGKHTGELCPLKHTKVSAEISGFVARVTVTQEFENTSSEKIEALYTFPLPRLSAVDDMRMTVGSRTVRAEIKRREEARRIYEEARNRGHVASLLEQQRPNVFTQSVANIEPGVKVTVTISYVDILKYEEGRYEFSFPMTVGPRYNDQGLNPKYAPPATRAGHDLSLDLTLDAGMNIDSIVSPTHEIDVKRPSQRQATLRLRSQTVIPNKDFILRYDVAGARIQDALLTHHDARGGFFTFILQPPERVTLEDITPKELVFVLDTSGSMSGFPIEKAKEAMRMAIAGLYPRDTFNLITFAGDTRILFPEPVAATPENVRQAQQFLNGAYGSGGTEMMKAVRAAFAPSGENGKVRIICFMTDGYVGNENEIIAEVRRHPEARVFSFGIGSSVNRYLLDKMAEEGRGEVDYVGLNDDGSAAARRFHERVRNPLLTDVTVEWNGLPVSDVLPHRIPDLFSAQPVVLHGRYGAAASGSILLRGRMSGKPFSRSIPVVLPANEPAHDPLASLWARRRIEQLSGMTPPDSRKEEIVQLGLTYRLMTAFTSLVAVEDQVVTRDGKPVTVQVPVEMPEGVSHEGVFGPQEVASRMAMGGSLVMMKSAASPEPPSKRPTPRMEVAAQDADLRESKLDRPLSALLQAPGNGALLVEVEIWLSDVRPDVLASLKKLGFVESGEPKVAKIRRGRIPLSAVKAVERLAEVIKVTLATQK
ncbi:MAG: VWA domain-containing protein [Acidobacteria bacterium]|nr:VWA domain-containing protein [Acidobacteriota bacterium]